MPRSVFLFALLTAAFWGLYGPALGKARGELASPFKPYAGIVLAYALSGIVFCLIPMYLRGESWVFTGKGLGWGTVAGALGAAGAFCLTLAMVSGGGRMPHVVMSLVFPGAVTVSALAGLWQTWGKAEVKPTLWLGITVVLVGVIIVTASTPQAHAPKP